MTDVKQSGLGKETVYDNSYNPSLLFPLSRAENRSKLNIEADLPFCGEDVWTCYELSWLDLSGKPQVGIATFRFPVDSPFLIESKSFKLYLNSLNHKNIENTDALTVLLTADLSLASEADVSVKVYHVQDEQLLNIERDTSLICLDDLPLNDLVYQPDSGLLHLDDTANGIYEEYLCSHLLRSNCPVTGQPDWGTVYIRYRGKKISHESLLRYVISFRQCQDFHEHCVERMFVDILNRCECESLSVYARYTRRGGLDINPYRATATLNASAEDIRTARQ
jgi:7-cyano-7-deazaguanine reductase